MNNTDEFDFTSKGITTKVIDEYGNNLVPIVNERNRQPGKRCLQLIKFLLIHFGLTAFMAAYLVAGGYLFKTLELNNESENCKLKERGYLSKLNSTSNKIMVFLKSNNDDIYSKKYVLDLMIQFSEALFVLDFQPSTNCSAILNSVDGANWNLINSIYFCVTVVTTIGYGHIAPSTYWGRISCIIYSIIGIPIMLIFLAIIGNMLANLFRFVFVNLICCRCFYDNIRNRRQKRKERFLQLKEDLRKHRELEARRRGLSLPPPMLPSQDDDDDDDEFDNLHKTFATDLNELNVPLIISIGVMIGYTLIGALIFPIWEDWTLADAAYFSFVTISTIGFGDLVPGSGRLNDPKTAIELGVGGLYTICGLALLSMCLNLLQDELVQKVQYVSYVFSMCKGSNKKVDDCESESNLNTNNITQYNVGNEKDVDNTYLTQRNISVKSEPNFQQYTNVAFANEP